MIWKLAFAFGHAQAWIAKRRIASVGTWKWSLWFLAWMPFRAIFCALFAYQKWVYA